MPASAPEAPPPAEPEAPPPDKMPIAAPMTGLSMRPEVMRHARTLMHGELADHSKADYLSVTNPDLSKNNRGSWFRLDPTKMKQMSANAHGAEASLRDIDKKRVEHHWHIVGERRKVAEYLSTSEAAASPELEAEDARQQEQSRWFQFDAFFGFFLILNGVVIGLQTDLKQDDDFDLGWYVIENAFMFIFVLELFLRVYKTCAEKNSIRLGLVKCSGDIWMWFDSFLITISALDTYFLSAPYLEMEDSGVDLRVLSVLRTFRLFRLARLVRIFKYAQELWLLVSGLQNGVKTLIWTVLLLALDIYACAIIVTVTLKDDPQLGRIFPRVFDSMFVLLRIATLEDWAELTWNMALTRSWLMPFMLCFICVSTFGILNLIVGVMVNAAMGVSRQDKQMVQLQRGRTRKQAFKRLKELMAYYDNRPQLKDPNEFTRADLFQMIEDSHGDSPEIKELFHILEVSPGELKKLLEGMEFGQAINVDELIEGFHWTDTVLSGTDVLFMNFAYNEIETKTTQLEEHSTVMFSWMYDILRSLADEAASAFGAYTRGNADSWVHEQFELLHGQLFQKIPADYKNASVKELSKAMHMAGHADAHESKNPAEKAAFQTAEDDQKRIQKQAALDKQASMGSGMDLLFGFIVLLNGICIGIQTQLKSIDGLELSNIFQIVELSFLGIFVVELGIRFVLHAQIQEGHDSYLWLKIFPRMPETLQDVKIVLKHLKTYFCDAFSLFDFCIVVVCIYDSVIMQFFIQTSQRGGMFAVLRLVRMLRLARLVRLFKLLKELYMIVRGISSSAMTVIWTSLLLGLCIYIVGVFCVKMIGRNEEFMALSTYDWYEDRFKYVFPSMFTLLAFTTFDNWGETIHMIHMGSPVLAWLLIPFLVLCGMGFFNLIIGVMCESAHQVVSTDNFNHHLSGLSEFRRHVGLLKKGLVEYLSSTYNEHMDLTINDSFLVTREMIDDAWSFEYSRKIFSGVGLSRDEMQTIIDRLDVEHTDSIPIDTFLAGCLHFHQDLAGLDFLVVHSLSRCGREHISTLRKSLLDFQKIFRDNFMQLYDVIQGIAEPAKQYRKDRDQIMEARLDRMRQRFNAYNNDSTDEEDGAGSSASEHEEEQQDVHPTTMEDVKQIKPRMYNPREVGGLDARANAELFDWDIKCQTNARHHLDELLTENERLTKHRNELKGDLKKMKKGKVNKNALSRALSLVADTSFLDANGHAPLPEEEAENGQDANGNYLVDTATAGAGVGALEDS